MSDTPIKIEVNCATGIAVEVPLTAEEIAQRQADAIAAAEEQAKREADEAKIADAKLSAQAKLAKLGLTGDEISALTK